MSILGDCQQTGDINLSVLFAKRSLGCLSSKSQKRRTKLSWVVSKFMSCLCFLIFPFPACLPLPHFFMGVFSFCLRNATFDINIWQKDSLVHCVKDMIQLSTFLSTLSTLRLYTCRESPERSPGVLVKWRQPRELPTEEPTIPSSPTPPLKFVSDETLEKV